MPTVLEAMMGLASGRAERLALRIDEVGDLLAGNSVIRHIEAIARGISKHMIFELEQVSTGTHGAKIVVLHMYVKEKNPYTHVASFRVDLFNPEPIDDATIVNSISDGLMACHERIEKAVSDMRRQAVSALATQSTSFPEL